jgi:hypothetical protein
MMSKRQSIEPTHDHQETGDRYHVTTRIDNRTIALHEPVADPFVSHRVTVGWRDLLRGLARRRLEVTVLVGGDSEIVEDVMELNADYLGSNCTRRDEFNVTLNASLETFGAAIADDVDDLEG